MIELRPLLQLNLEDGIPVLKDLLTADSFSFTDVELLRYIPAIAKNTPAQTRDLAASVADALDVDQTTALAAIEALVELGLLVPSASISSQKAGIQLWVDKGWVDALILHFASRNLSYNDDPIEFGGLEDIKSYPEPMESKRRKRGTATRLVKPSWELPAAVILDGLMNRRSFKPFTRKQLSITEVSEILWFGNLYARERAVIAENRDFESPRDIAFDSAFSALSTFVVTYGQIDWQDGSLPPGVYRYNVVNHELEAIRAGDFKLDMAKLAIGQSRASSGLFTFVICGDLKSYTSRYRHERSYRNLLINTSQLAQFYLTLATINDFNTFLTPAIHDEKMHLFLEAEDDLPLYLVTAG